LSAYQSRKRLFRIAIVRVVMNTWSVFRGHLPIVCSNNITDSIRTNQYSGWRGLNDEQSLSLRCLNYLKCNT
jgi:hypothetical protein